MWPIGLSARLPVVRHGGPLPRRLPDGPRAIPSRQGFSRGAMGPGVSGITRRFRAAIPGRGQVGHVLLSRSPLYLPRSGVPFDLHVLGAPPAFILSQDRTLRPKCIGLRARPVLSVHRRSVPFDSYGLSIGKEFSRGRLSAALRKTNPSQTISNGSMSARMRHPEVSILAVSGSQGARPAADPVRPGRAARRYIARPEGPRGRESGRTHFLHILRPCLRLPAVLYRSPRASLSCSVIWLKLIGSLGQGTAGIEQPIALLHREPLGIYANHRFGPAGADQQPGVILECQT